MEMEARNIYGISAATATIGHGVPLWAGLRQYLVRLIYDWFLVNGLDVTGVTEHEKNIRIEPLTKMTFYTSVYNV